MTSGRSTELACTPFTLRAFSDRWKEFGWSYKPETHPEFSFRVELPGDLFLTVDPLREQVRAAQLPFYYWEDYNPADHDDQEQFQHERAEYDVRFELAKKEAEEILPPAFQY